MGRTGFRLVSSLLGLFIVALASAQSSAPWVGQKGIQETTAQIMAREAASPRLEFGSSRPLVFGDARPVRSARPFKADTASDQISRWPQTIRSLRDGTDTHPALVGTSFMATQLSDTPGFVPPDTMGDVGPTDILVMVNGSIRSFTKAGALTALNTTTDNFFNSVRNGGTTFGPQVKYDRLSQRWILSISTIEEFNNRVLLAVSNGSTINASTTWTFFFYTIQNGGGGTIDNGGFMQDLSLGVDANALYIGCNVFKGSFHGTTGFVIRKSSVLGPGPIIMSAFRQLATATGAGPFAPRGVTNFDPAATEGYFIGVDNATFGTLMLRRVSNPGTSPTISNNVSIAVPATGYPQDFSFSGSAPLEALDDRLFSAAIFKDKVSGVSSLWTAHNMEVDFTGAANPLGNRNGSRWYQLTNLNATPTLVQAGTLFDSSATTPKSYWIPSVAMNGQGHMAIGSSFGSAVDKVGCAVSGRFAGDPLGSTQPPTLAVTSLFNYNINPPQWGEYSVTVVDPSDDMTMWTFQEYCNANNSWGIRVIQIPAPPPATPSSAYPSTIQGQSNVNVVVTGTSVAGSGFFDAGPGFSPLSATVSGVGVTINSVAFTDPTHVTLNVNVSGDAPIGTRDVTIRNSDGQTMTGFNVLSVEASTGIPAITALSPNSAVAGGPAFTLTVNGLDFSPTSEVRWNGEARPTTFVSAQLITADIPASDIASVCTATVSVIDTNGTSNEISFPISAIELAPNSLTRLLGQPISGGLPDLAVSDNIYLVGAFRYDGLRTQPNLQWEMGANSPLSTISRLDLFVELKANTAGLQQVIQMKNQVTGQWETLDSSLTTLAEVTKHLTITSGPSDYVGVDGLIQIRLNFKELSPPFSIPRVSVDYVHFTALP